MNKHKQQKKDLENLLDFCSSVFTFAASLSSSSSDAHEKY